MSNIRKFPGPNLRQEIHDGRVSAGTKELIRTVLAELREFRPNSWDRNFCEDMLVTREPMTDKQSIQLERILDDILAKTEHPSFTPRFDFLNFAEPSPQSPR